jgi:hypothetical protein
VSAAGWIALVAGLLAALAASVVLARRRAAVWERFARVHRLDFRREGRTRAPVVGGEVDGRTVILRVASESSDTGLLGAAEEELALALRRPLPADLQITHRTAVDALGSAPDVTTGDEPFDREALVRGTDQGAIRAYLTPRRRQAIHVLLGLAGSGIAGLSEGRVWLRERRSLASLARLERRFARLAAIADELDPE